MKKECGVLPFIFLIIAAALLNSSPVLAQKKSVDNSINSDTSLDLSGSKDDFKNIYNQKNAHPKEVDIVHQKYSQGQTYLDKVTDFNQLQDVSRQHWAYEALRSLVENYACINIPEGKFNGNRTMSRYEFAVAFNTCLARIEALIASSSNNLLKLEDLKILDRLQREFAAELLQVRNRVDNLENQITSIEINQFSTTTILKGTVDFYIISAFGDVQAAAPGENQRDNLDDNLSFSSRAVLDFDTSFTGKD